MMNVEGWLLIGGEGERQSERQREMMIYDKATANKWMTDDDDDDDDYMVK